MHKRITDTLLLSSVLALLGIGVIMVYSTSSITALRSYHDEYFFLKKELLYASLGILFLLIFARIPYQHLGKRAYLTLGLSFLGLLLVLVPGVGVCIGGAKRWIHCGPLSMQPAEFAKLGLIIYLSFFLYKKQENLKKFSTGLLPPLVITSIFSGLVLLQPDFGTTFLLVSLLFILLFVGGGRILHLALVLIVFGCVGIFLVVKSPYRLERVLSFLDPWKDPMGTGFQIIQSFIAFGTGGIFGQGLGNGKQKLFYLPEAHTDFIFSVLGEELGLIGVLIVISLFLIVIYCGIRIALRSRDYFGTYLAVGIISLVGLQAIVNMGVVMGLLPTKGTTLPFISYGGTSLMISLVGVGILLNISSQSRAYER
jgi:cell division protein FtsW